MAQILRLRLRKDYFEPYLRKKFSTKPGEPIAIDRKTSLGKFIHSHAKSYEFPTRKTTDGTTDIVLSDYKYSYQNRRFIGFDKDDVEKINDLLEAHIELEIREMMVVGLELGLNRKTIISTFIQSVLGTEKYEMIKKDDYRRRKKAEELLAQHVQVLGVK